MENLNNAVFELVASDKSQNTKVLLRWIESPSDDQTFEFKLFHISHSTGRSMEESRNHAYVENLNNAGNNFELVASD